MPAQGLLQRFHDLAEADDVKRCIAAVAVKRSLKAGSDEPGEDLQYALKRLVRGVQSSRACSRQGFSLALAEVLSALPDELPAVLALIKQLTALQAGLKASEQKERLLGRLFAYAAILESGCLKEAFGSKAEKGKKPVQNAAAELGSGLAEMYEAKPYLRAPAARMLADLCKNLSAAGLVSEVPAAIEKWTLDAKIGSSIDVYTAGIVLELRLLLEDAEQEAPGSSVAALKTWPSCVRKDAFGQAPAFRLLANSLADALATTPLGDALPWTVDPFCRWWLRVFKTRDCLALQGELWRALEEKLFPEKASQAALAQAFRALGELATKIREASAGSPHAGPLLRGLFESCPAALAQLFKGLCYQRTPSHEAAAFSQRLLAEAIGAPAPAQKGNSASSSASKPPAVQIDDDARLAILACLQRHKGFSTMKGNYQRLWQEVLLTPLSSQGVRTRCISLLGEMQQAAAANDVGGAGGVRVGTEQLVKLVKHACAPDEVVLAVLCLLLTASYFAPSAGDASSGYSFGAFAKSAGLSIANKGDDLLVPVLASTKPAPRETGDDEANEKASGKKEQWSVKLWSALAGIQRRPGAERLAAAVGTAGGAEAQPIKTFAYHGCLSDGTLWVMRLHEWWDYITESAPLAPAASPRLSPRSKRRREAGAGIQCLVQLNDEDKKLRKRCIEVCKGVLSAPEVEGALSSRQRNALCALPLCLALTLLDAKNDEELDIVRENLKEAIRFVDELPAPSASEKKRAKSEQQRSEILGAVSRMAAELFVQSTGLTKEAARNAWRELGTFAAPETVLGLCASVRDVAEDDEEDDEKKAEDGSDEESGPDSDDEKDHAPNSSEAKRAIAMGAAVAAAKARASAGDEDEDANEIILDGDDVWDKLLEDGDEAGGSLLEAFASAGLQGEDAEGRKMSKRQQRLQVRQEEVTRKFGEVELLEVYLKGHGAVDVSCMKPMWVQVLKELYDALLSAGRRHNGGVGGKAEDKAKKTKVDAVIRKMESDLIHRLAGMLNRTLKQLRSGSTMRQIDKWHSEAEWADHARTFFESAQANQTGASGQSGADAGAMLLFWFCSMHRIKSLRSSGKLEAESEGSEPSTKGWALAEELLGRCLADWSTTKKDEEQRWCGAVLGAFASRVPHVLLGLPWCEKIRTCRNSFGQRSLVSMLVNQIFKSPVMKPSAATGKLAADFAGLCCELLKGTTEDSSKLNKLQRQKVKHQFLSAVNTTLTMTLQLKPRSPIQGKLAKTIRETLTSARDSPGITYGKLYSLSNNALRLLRRQDGSIAAAAAATSGGSETDPQTRKAPSSPTLKRKARPGASGDVSPKLKRRRGPGDVPAPAADDAASDGGGSSSKGAKRSKSAKGAKNFFGEM